MVVKGLVTALLCGFAVVVQMRAQEVVVARETRSDAPKQAACHRHTARVRGRPPPNPEAREAYADLEQMQETAIRP